MPAKKYVVSLTLEERNDLEHFVNTGKAAAYKINHARILLKADTQQRGGGWTDATISQALDISVATIERVRQRFVEPGLTAALEHKKQSQRRVRAFDGEQEAHLIALTCSNPPVGRGRWSLRLLAAQMVSLEDVETVSYETVRQTLKTTNSSPGSSNPVSFL